MKEVIPAILTNDPEELVRLVHVFERMGVERVHLDICDGIFVPTRTVAGYDELRRMETKLKFDIHLMVKDPEHLLDHWHGLSADRFIFHVESSEMLSTLVEHCHSHGHKFWAAKNPETSVEKFDFLLDSMDGAMFMTVHPGRQGNPFVDEVLSQIKDFKDKNNQIPVMVDGGITPETAPRCAAAGADVFASGSYIINSPDPAQAMKDIQDSVD